MTGSDAGETESAAAVRRQWFLDILKIVVVAALFAGLAVFFASEAGRGVFDISSWRVALQQGGSVGSRSIGMLVFVLAGGAVISLGVPRLWIAAIGGAIYGAMLGTLLSLLAALLGAAALYEVGRFFFRDLLSRRLGSTLSVWKQRFRQSGFWWVLYGRLMPISNATVLSLLCGSCGVGFTAYLLASLLGFIPLTLAFALFGSGGAKAHSVQIMMGFGLMLLAFLSRNFLQRMAKRTESA